MARVTVVTGGTDGIGRAVALALAAGGDRVLVVGRSEQRAAAVLAAMGPGADHAFVRADLSLMAQTARVADEVAALTDRVDAVVCCAGILSTVPQWTAEGLERSFALNYLSRYLLVRRLLPALERAPSGRVVLVSNAGMYPDTLDFGDLQHRRGRPGLMVSGRTQFANDLWATELADRVHGTGVEVTCVYPGLVRTGVFRHARGLPRLARMMAPVVQRVVARSPESAARTPVFLAQDPRAVAVNGAFFGPRRRPRTVPERARRADRRRLLWEASEGLVQPYLMGVPFGT